MVDWCRSRRVPPDTRLRGRELPRGAQQGRRERHSSPVRASPSINHHAPWCSRHAAAILRACVSPASAPLALPSARTCRSAAYDARHRAGLNAAHGHGSRDTRSTCSVCVQKELTHSLTSRANAPILTHHIESTHTKDASGTLHTCHERVERATQVRPGLVPVHTLPFGKSWSHLSRDGPHSPKVDDYSAPARRHRRLHTPPATAMRKGLHVDTKSVPSRSRYAHHGAFDLREAGLG